MFILNAFMPVRFIWFAENPPNYSGKFGKIKLTQRFYVVQTLVFSPLKTKISPLTLLCFPRSRIQNREKIFRE